MDVYLLYVLCVVR